MTTYEIINLIIQGVIALAASLVFYQIYLTKENNNITLRRESLKYSAELIEFFRSNILKFNSEFSDKIKEINFKELDKKSLESFRNFTVDELPLLSRPSIGAISENLVLLKSHINIAVEQGNLLNMLESFSCSFVARVADEHMAFDIVGKAFCEIIKNNYLMLLIARDEVGFKEYQSVVDLYKIWIERLNFKKLIDEEESLKIAIEKIERKELTPLGVNKISG